MRTLRGRADLSFLTASDGVEALEILRSHSVDVLVSDIDMPRMNGLELVRIARREFPTTLRILLTGAGTMDRAVAAINDGEVARFFAKPFDSELLSRALAELAERILLLRRERHAEAQRARCDEFFHWVEGHYPGALTFVRGPQGEVVVDMVALRTYLESAPPGVQAIVDLDGDYASPRT
jgi:YesN/AraC family two-component response regulator